MVPGSDKVGLAASIQDLGGSCNEKPLGSIVETSLRCLRSTLDRSSAAFARKYKDTGVSGIDLVFSGFASLVDPVDISLVCFRRFSNLLMLLCLVECSLALDESSEREASEIVLLGGWEREGGLLCCLCLDVVLGTPLQVGL